MDEEFLEPRDHIDTDALVSRLRELAATRSISTNGHAPVDEPSEELTGFTIPDALAAQAELNRLVTGALERVGAYLSQLEGEVSALRRENGELSERIARLSEQVERAPQARAHPDPADPSVDLEALRSSLQVSLAGVEALLNLRGRGD